MDQVKKDIPVLSINNLCVEFYHTASSKNKKILNGVSFAVNPGEIVGIVGESGSGKSMTALSIMGILPKIGKIQAGSILYNGGELKELSEKEYQKLRGSELSMVFQEPMTSLNPVLSIGSQVEEVLKLHEKLNSEERQKRVIEMLSEVELQEPEFLLKKYPHQLSGGMRQRVMIAMAMICQPKLLIADEPTTALDVSIQSKILDLLKRLNKTHNTAILLISHDLGIVKNICSRVLIMYQGRVVEEGRVDQLFLAPKKEYTKNLLAASGYSGKMAISFPDKRSSVQENVLLKVSHLNVFYEQKKEKLFSRSTKKQAVRDAAFTVNKGEIVGIVGESGCGKSSLAKAVAGLQTNYTGEINLYCNRPQMVFQDPYGSLNLSKRIGWLLEEPLRLQGGLSKKEREDKVLFLLERVGLQAEYALRYPSELSGGQRQRIAIAIAVIGNKELIILDEPVSALDVTVQSQILDLLLALREEFGLSYVFISHDMKVIRRVCDRVCVMYQGEIIETSDTVNLFENPQKEYTKKLLGFII